jgi:hypothetical protein
VLPWPLPASRATFDACAAAPGAAAGPLLQLWALLAGPVAARLQAGGLPQQGAADAARACLALLEAPLRAALQRAAAPAPVAAAAAADEERVPSSQPEERAGAEAAAAAATAGAAAEAELEAALPALLPAWQQLHGALARAAERSRVADPQLRLARQPERLLALAKQHGAALGGSAAAWLALCRAATCAACAAAAVIARQQQRGSGAGAAVGSGRGGPGASGTTQQQVGGRPSARVSATPLGTLGRHELPPSKLRPAARDAAALLALLLQQAPAGALAAGAPQAQQAAVREAAGALAALFGCAADGQQLAELLEAGEAGLARLLAAAAAAEQGTDAAAAAAAPSPRLAAGAQRPEPAAALWQAALDAAQRALLAGDGGAAGDGGRGGQAALDALAPGLEATLAPGGGSGAVALRRAAYRFLEALEGARGRGELQARRRCWLPGPPEWMLGAPRSGAAVPLPLPLPSRAHRPRAPLTRRPPTHASRRWRCRRRWRSAWPTSSPPTWAACPSRSSSRCCRPPAPRRSRPPPHPPHARRRHLHAHPAAASSSSTRRLRPAQQQPAVARAAPAGAAPTWSGSSRRRRPITRT